MRKPAFILLFAFTVTVGFAQRIQYSRQTFRSPFADAVQVVADVDGYHHVLCLTAGKKPLLYVFDGMMQSVTKKEIDVKLQVACDVRTLVFKDYYFLYLHVPGTVLHQLFRVGAEGETEDVSEAFSNGADTVWNRSTATFQLYKNGNRLSVVTHTYYDAVKSIGSRVVRFDPALRPVQVSTVFWPFEKDVDYLQQTVLAGNTLLALKTFKDAEHGNSLDLIKVNVASGETLSTSFASGSLLYNNPAMQVSEADSSITIHSVLHDPVTAQRFQRRVFIANVDSLLRIKRPLATLKLPFQANAAAGFLLVNGVQPHWLSVQNFFRIVVGGNRTVFPPASGLYGPGRFNNAFLQSYGYESEIAHNMPSAVHLTVLNRDLTVMKDSVAENRGSFYEVQPRPFAQFTLGGKAYLLLIENFSIKKHGLVLFTDNGKGDLSTTSLPVFDRYDYMIPQVQAVKNYFVLPYAYKNEIGLVKITFTE